MLTLEALRVLEAINRNGSFALAAEELHKVRSALTYTVRRLEQSLNVKLFCKQGRVMKLTPIGEVLLKEGEVLLQQSELLEQKIHNLASGWETELRISYDDILPISIVYDALLAFQKQCPATTRFSLQAERLSGAWDALLDRRVDLVIGASGDIPGSIEIACKKIAEVEFAFVVAPDHPLAALPDSLSAEDIFPYPIVTVRDTSMVLPRRTTGVLSGQRTFSVDSVHAKIQAHLMGVGVGTLPKNLIHDYIQKGLLVEKKLQKTKSLANLSLAWRTPVTGKALQWFIDYFDNF